MNANCIICSDLFSPRSEIYSTSCGHLFHYVCLIQWIERSKTCPQCRHKENEKTMHRIYFNIQSSEAITDDVVTLQAKVDNGNFQMSLKEKDILNYSEKYQKCLTASVGLKELVVDLHEKHKTNTSAMLALKDQIRYFKEKLRDKEKCVREITRLKDEIENMGYLRTVLNGGEDDVEDIVRKNKDARSLSLLVATVKKELIEADRNKQKLTSQLRTFKSEVQQVNSQADGVQQEISRQKEINTIHDKCPSTISSLKQELADLLTKSVDIDPNDSVHRAVYSPGPLRNELNNGFLDDSVKASPTIAERVAQIKASNSPYLTIEDTGNGYGSLLHARFKTPTQLTKGKGASDTDKYSLFHMKTKVQAAPANKSDYSYNGLGGHSKEDVFPQPKKTSSKVILKRVKSNSSLTSSAKFRKLAPGKSAPARSK